MTVREPGSDWPPLAGRTWCGQQGTGPSAPATSTALNGTGPRACGTASQPSLASGKRHWPTKTIGILGVSLAFGLSLLVAAYAIAGTPSRAASRLGRRGLKRQKALREGAWAEVEPLVRWLGVRCSPLLSDDAWNALDKRIAFAGDFLGLLPEELVALILPRIQAIRERMAPGSTLWLHLDHRAVHEAKVAVDRVFGRAAFFRETA